MQLVLGVYVSVECHAICVMLHAAKFYYAVGLRRPIVCKKHVRGEVKLYA